METTLPSAGAADGNLSGTCLPESFFRYMLTTNPFVLNRATADGAERPDAGQIHSPIFGRLIELACESVRLQRGLGVLLSGEAGSGKTHILGRLARWSAVGSRACFVVVRGLQTILTNGAPGQWNTTPQGIDGSFGPHTRASVIAFQNWGHVAADGIVGDQTWAVSLHAMMSTLESAVGLNYVIG